MSGERETPKREALRLELEELSERSRLLSSYIREKADRLLVMMGSRPLDAAGLDDRTLVALDPIGTIADSFSQVITHIHDVNAKLRSEIAERRRVEEALREKEGKYRTLAEFASDWVFWRGPDEKLIYVAPACEAITGYTPREFYANPCLAREIVHPDDRERWDAHCHVADEQGMPGAIEMRIVTKQGEARWISHVCRPVYGEDGVFLGVRGSNSNATEKKRAMDALEESEDRLRDFLDGAIDLIQSVSPEGRFLYVNRAWRETLGYDNEAIGRMTLLDIVAPDRRDHCAALFDRVLAGEDVGRIETRFVARDGRIVTVEGHVNCRFEDGRPVATRSIFRDITDKKRMEEEIQKASTLESLGVLAGGIAHDFNNILTAILGNISLARLGLPPGVAASARLDEAETASFRAKALTQQLLTFSKGGAPIRQTASAAELIRETAGFALRGSNVRCEFEIPADLWPVVVDEAQVSQVINNIIMNADQAMPDGGIIEVRAGNAAVGAGDEPPLKKGDYVKISIRDHGIGISTENLLRIFNPFYTTKEKGSGLGLTTAYSIIRRHEGTIRVESTVGAGTKFSIFLPATRKTPQEKGDGGARHAPGRGKVLVMDDEKALRDVAVDILGAIGYEGAAVKDGAEALAVYRAAMETGRPFDAVIMDLTIPGGMGGKEAVRKLLEIDPAAKAIVSSGYSSDPVMSDFRRYGFRGVIAKPYRVRELGEVLGSVVSG